MTVYVDNFGVPADVTDEHTGRTYDIPLGLLRVTATETSHWEYVHGPNDNWHLTCSRCGSPIYPGQEALITEDAGGRYVKAECCVPCP